MISLIRFADAREAFRHKGLRQALYDEGHHLMEGVIVNLHGVAHLDRRRLENRLFRRDTFAWYEAERIPTIIDGVLAPAVRTGRGDLLPLARRTMLTLSLMVAGVDRKEDSDEELDAIYGLMDRLARASTVAHAVGDKDAIVADGDRALEEFAGDFFQPSRQRRLEILSRFASGAISEEDLPKDVLTTLLRNQDRLVLPEDTVLRETAYFPWVGSHSTSNQLVHAMHHVFEWIAEHPDDRQRLLDEPVVFQRFVHESLRLHPASPVSMRIALEDIELKSGLRVASGETVAIRLDEVNRDRAVWGDGADRFDPFREIPEGVMPWGLSFGHGVHACLGQELAGGLEFLDADLSAVPDGHLVGAITVMGRAMLEAGARPDPTAAPQQDRSTTRHVWGSYPVVFGPAAPDR